MNKPQWQTFSRSLHGAAWMAGTSPAKTVISDKMFQ